MANPLRTIEGEIVMKKAAMNEITYNQFMYDLEILIVEWNIAEDKFNNTLNRKEAKLREIANLPPLR
jgi:hypothetical protein